MADITKSIGATGRDYSTFTAWEADLDNGAVYTSGDNAIGEAYDDAVFDEGFTVNGGSTVGLNSIRLSAASGHRHDGTAGTGARLVYSTSRFGCEVTTAPPVGGLFVEWLECDANDTYSTFGRVPYNSNTRVSTFRNLILHNVESSGGSFGPFACSVAGSIAIHDCFIYRVTHVSGSGLLYGPGAQSSSRPLQAYNSTIFGYTHDGTGDIYGIQCWDVASHVVRNVISVGVGGITSGSKGDFRATTIVSATLDHNISSDSTAVGTGSLTSRAPADLFVSTTVGAEDLHLKAGADAIDAGVDLGTTANIDIDGRDRDAEGDTWDIGADEYVAEGGGPVEKTVSETLAVQISEAALLSGTLARTDALSARLDEAASVAATLARSDTLAILLSEVAALLGTYVTADTLAVRFDDAPVLLALVGPVIDTLAPTLTEGAGQVVVALTVSDGLTPRLDEATPGLLVQVTRSDTAAVVLSEATGVAAVLAASDTLHARLDDVPAVAATVSAIDVLPVQLEEAAGTAVLITASDVLAPRLDEGTPALLVRLERVDALGVMLTEGRALDVALHRADGLSVALEDAAVIAAALTAQDWLTLALGETLTKAVYGPGGPVIYVLATVTGRGVTTHAHGDVTPATTPAGKVTALVRPYGRVRRLS